MIKVPSLDIATLVPNSSSFSSPSFTGTMHLLYTCGKIEIHLSNIHAREEFRKEFVGNVAHELKTPLFTVQGYISTLLDGAMSDPEVLKKYLIPKTPPTPPKKNRMK